MTRLLASTLGVALLVSSSCAKVERERGAAPLQASRTIARASIVAAEGGVVAPNGPDAIHPGVRIEFPPGALSADTEIEIVVHYGDQRLPSVIVSFEIRPPGLRLASDATVTIQYDRVYASTVGHIWHESSVRLYSFVDDPHSDESSHQVESRALDENLISGSTNRLGTFFAMHAPLHQLIDQPTRLVDPRVPLRAALIDGTPTLSTDGPIEISIGRGDMGSFWAGTAEDNLLVLPGLMADPLVLASPGSILPQDPTAGLNGDFANIVVFQYPSGHALGSSANQLYQLIRDNAGPSFGCSVVAHGSGGLIARYAIEQSHADATRPGFVPGDPKLDAWIDRVVFIGTPNQGAPVAQSQFETLLSLVLAADARFVQGVVDLLPGMNSFVANLNRTWTAPASRYYAIAGDVGGAQSDGLVDVVSAVGVPRSTTRPDAYQVFSGPIYDHASLLAFADRTGVVEQAREWFGKDGPQTSPMIGSVATPSGPAAGIIEIPFAVSDAQHDACFVTGIYSVDGSNWRLATSADGALPLTLGSVPAPGASHVFRWNSVVDRVGRFGFQRVVVRIMVSDYSGPGIAGETGEFTVLN